MQLRKYQKEAITGLKSLIHSGAKRPILGMPTGAGKTVTFAYIVSSALSKGSKVLVVAHRKELIEQARNTMSAYGVDVEEVHFGMVQTFVRSPHKIPAVDLCIVDECHIGNFRRFIDLLNPKTQVIGVTATPLGASKKKPLRDTFDDVFYSVQISELLEMGYLSFPNYHIWKLDESNLKKDTKGEFTASSQASVFSINNLLEAVDNRVGKTIIFCSSVAQCEQVYEAIDERRKFVVHSKMPYDDRKDRVDMFKRLEGGIMINCGILTAGFDCPDIETVIVYRATTSLPLWLQMVGRGARVTESKNNFYVFDLGNNHNRLLPWEASRDWNAIFHSQGKRHKEGAAPIRECPECGAQVAASSDKCKFCGHEKQVKEKEEMHAKKIEVISDYNELPPALRKPFDKMSVEELVQRAAYGSPSLKRPYKVSWIVQRLKVRDSFEAEVIKLAEIKGYKPNWARRQISFNKNKTLEFGGIRKD